MFCMDVAIPLPALLKTHRVIPETLCLVTWAGIWEAFLHILAIYQAVENKELGDNQAS